jgi:hypothetical protein
MGKREKTIFSVLLPKPMFRVIEDCEVKAEEGALLSPFHSSVNIPHYFMRTSLIAEEEEKAEKAGSTS